MQETKNNIHQSKCQWKWKHKSNTETSFNPKSALRLELSYVDISKVGGNDKGKMAGAGELGRSPNVPYNSGIA